MDGIIAARMSANGHDHAIIRGVAGVRSVRSPPVRPCRLEDIVDIPTNSFKRAIRAGTPQIGLWCSTCSPYVTEVVAGSGFDWLLLDTEHAPGDLQEVMGQLQACLESTAHPIVRPAWNDMVLAKRYLDVGAQTLLVPYVQTVEEARAAVAYTRYPPAGVRGVGGTTRATRFGRVADYFAKASEEICVLVQVETRLGLDNLDAIAAVDGVDGVFIGPSDLAAGLGHLGNPSHPDVKSAIDFAIRRVRELGKAPGFLTADDAHARHILQLGALFVAVGIDLSLLARETEKLARKFRP
jgi:4-hydroxy-2-oxoheptanedioate aldolase